jgi:hypothetical protein
MVMRDERGGFCMTWSGVRLATAGPLPPHGFAANVITMAANGALSIDGVFVTAGDRVLIKNEAASPGHPEHGLYLVTDPGSARAPAVLTRTTDWDPASDSRVGNAVFVLLGTQTGQVWYLKTAGAIALNATALEFVRASSPLPDRTANDAGYKAHKMGLAPL